MCAESRLPRKTLSPMSRSVSLVVLVLCLSSGVRRGRTEEAPATKPAADKHAEALRQLAQTQFEVAVSARDVEHDPIKAAHYFLHAGLNAHAAGDEQTAIDAGHAAQDVVGAVEFTFPHGANVSGAVLSPDQELLCSWSYDEHKVCVWSLKTGQLVKSLTLQVGVGRAQFHPTERTLLLDAYDLVAVWPFDKDEISHSFNPNAGKSSHGVTRSRFQGSAIWVAGSPHGWQWQLGKEPEKLDWEFAQVIGGNHTDFHADLVAVGDRTLATVVARSVGNIWDWKTGEHLRSYARGQVLRMVLNPHNRQVLTWSRPGKKDQTVAALWSLDQAEPLHELGEMAAPVNPILSPDGKHLVIWGDHYTSESDKGAHVSTALSLWSWADRKVVQTLPQDGTVAGTQFDSSGRHLVTWSQHGTVNLWRMVDEVSPITGEKRTQVVELLCQCQAEGGVASIQFHPTLPQVLIVNRKQQAHLFEIPKYRAFGDAALASKVISQFVSSVSGAEISRDGQRLVTWGDEPRVRVWNLEHGVPKTLLRTTNSIGSPPIPQMLTGDRILVGGYSDEPLSLWSLHKPEPIWKAPAGANYFAVDRTPSGDHLLLRRTELPAQAPKRNPNKPEVRPEPRAEPVVRLELWSIHQPAPLKAWPSEAKIRGDRGVCLLDDRRYLTWLEHDLWLHEIGREEPIRQWKATHWFYKATPFANGQRALVTTATANYGEGEVLVLSLDADKPLYQVPTRSDFLEATLLPNERGCLVWHRPFQQVASQAQLIFFDAQRPSVALEDFQSRDIEAIDFDAKPRYVVSSNFEQRRAWLWSAENGKRLYDFHRRGPKQSGFDENDLMNFKLDPQARFVVSCGASPNQRGSRLKIWNLAELKPNAEWKPSAQYDLPYTDILSVNTDGTFAAKVGGEVWLMSWSGRAKPLRRFVGRNAFSHVSGNRKTSQFVGTNPAGEIFEWRITHWTATDLRRELAELETRSGLRLDPALGRLR